MTSPHGACALRAQLRLPFHAPVLLGPPKSLPVIGWRFSHVTRRKHRLLLAGSVRRAWRRFYDRGRQQPETERVLKPPPAPAMSGAGAERSPPPAAKLRRLDPTAEPGAEALSPGGEPGPGVGGRRCGVEGGAALEPTFFPRFREPGGCGEHRRGRGGAGSHRSRVLGAREGEEEGCGGERGGGEPWEG